MFLNQIYLLTFYLKFNQNIIFTFQGGTPCVLGNGYVISRTTELWAAWISAVFLPWWQVCLLIDWHCLTCFPRARIITMTRIIFWWQIQWCTIAWLRTSVLLSNGPSHKETMILTNTGCNMGSVLNDAGSESLIAIIFIKIYFVTCPLTVTWVNLMFCWCGY